MVVGNGIRRIEIIDTTLRDGEQAPGVVFDAPQRERIATSLAAAGVDELEAGIPAAGRAEQEGLRALARLSLSSRLTAWCRAKASDIVLASRCGISGVHISFPVSNLHQDVTGMSAAEVLEGVGRLVQFARQYFDRVSVGAQDATRSETDFLNAFVDCASAAGADRIRVADTVGRAAPGQIFGLIRRLAERAGRMMIEYHGHNDLGMATANTVTAAGAGAGAVSVTVNGIGERAGNAPLEEVVVALKYGAGMESRVQPRKLLDICRYVADLTGRPIPEDKPVTGPAVFRHESGIHCHGLLRDTRSYQLFPPEEVGREKVEYVLGKYSGGALIRNLLKARGIIVDNRQSEILRRNLSEQVGTNRRFLTSDDLIRLYRTCSNKWHVS